MVFGPVFGSSVEDCASRIGAWRDTGPHGDRLDTSAPPTEGVTRSPGETGAAASRVEPARPDSTASPQNQPSILLLDDDLFMLGMQARMLRSMGYQRIDNVATAQAALTILRKEPQTVDVVVCDLKMPGMDGIEFLQSLSTGPFQGSVILLSGEGARIMHTVQKLLGGSQLVILGALEKPAGRAALRALLDCWKPHSAAAPASPAHSFTCADMHVANRDRQWVLHYQPQVDLRTGALAGMEALVRWNHPDHGLVYPDHFIGLAEDCGAVDALTDWVLREAMEQLPITSPCSG